jgi:hypothetical protein
MANSSSIKANLTLVTTLDTATNVTAFVYTATRPFVIANSNYICATAGLAAATLTVTSTAGQVGIFTTANPSAVGDNISIAKINNNTIAKGNTLSFAGNGATVLGVVNATILPSAI